MAAPPVVMFDSAGNLLKAWGGAGAGYDWPEREHGIHVDPKGFVWISGNYCPTGAASTLKPVSDDQLLKFTGDGKFVLQIGKSNQSKGNADRQNVHRAADIWLHPATNELFVADGYVNRRVIVFDASTGAYKRMWGAYGNPPDDEAENRPQYEGPGARQFNTVHGIRVSDDGLVYVADRRNNRMQIFRIDGTFEREAFVERPTRLLGTAFSVSIEARRGVTRQPRDG